MHPASVCVPGDSRAVTSPSPGVAPLGHMDSTSSTGCVQPNTPQGLNPRVVPVVLLQHSGAQAYLHDVLVDVLGISVDQVDLLGVLVLDDDPLLQLAPLLCHGCGAVPVLAAGQAKGSLWPRLQQLPCAPGTAPG